MSRVVLGAFVGASVGACRVVVVWVVGSGMTDPKSRYQGLRRSRWSQSRPCLSPRAQPV